MSVTDVFREQCIAELSEGGQPSVPEKKLEEIDRLNKEGRHFEASLKIQEFDESSPISYDELRDMADDNGSGWDLGEHMRERAAELSETDDGEPTREEKLAYLKGKSGPLAENLREELTEERSQTGGSDVEPCREEKLAAIEGNDSRLAKHIRQDLRNDE